MQIELYNYARAGLAEVNRKLTKVLHTAHHPDAGFVEYQSAHTFHQEMCEAVDVLHQHISTAEWVGAFMPAQEFDAKMRVLEARIEALRERGQCRNEAIAKLAELHTEMIGTPRDETEVLFVTQVNWTAAMEVAVQVLQLEQDDAWQGIVSAPRFVHELLSHLAATPADPQNPWHNGLEWWHDREALAAPGGIGPAVPRPEPDVLHTALAMLEERAELAEVVRAATAIHHHAGRHYGT